MIQITSLFLEDFDRYSLSQPCLTMNKIFKNQNFLLFIEKEEQNMPWDAYKVDKRWINAKNYGIEFKDEYEKNAIFHRRME